MNNKETAMSEDALIDKIRKRIEYEDELFNSRTTIFLATNGLWAAAVGVSSVLPLQIGIGILGVLVSIMWVMCSWQSWKVIRALTRNRLKLLKDQIEYQAEYQVEEIVQDALWRPGYRPTNILAKWLPILFLSIWVIFLGWLIWSLF
jgi:hypothetical protein